jgi:hypothetical protein
MLRWIFVREYRLLLKMLSAVVWLIYDDVMFLFVHNKESFQKFYEWEGGEKITEVLFLFFIFTEFIFEGQLSLSN